MRVAVPREIAPRETRVALVPETVARLTQAGIDIVVEAGAGEAAGHRDEAYVEARATVAPNAAATFAAGDVVLKVRGPMAPPTQGTHEADLLREDCTLIGFLGRDRNSELAKRLAARHVTAFSVELLPRISRAQKMDALSSMSTVAGYKAALLAAGALGRFFPLLMTAAGTVAPARVFVLGAGVAGLQAIATARRLGAVVEAFDVRPAVREEVQSLGATFVALESLKDQGVGEGGYARELAQEHQEMERQLLLQHVKTSDVVISTAMIPGRKAPTLITDAMVAGMKSGSVIIDLAAEAGGNCELTEPGQVVTRHGVSIHGPINLAATLPGHASFMYSRNLYAFLLHLVHDGALKLDFEDEITRESCLTRPAARPHEALAGERT